MLHRALGDDPARPSAPTGAPGTGTSAGSAGGGTRWRRRRSARSCVSPVTPSPWPRFGLRALLPATALARRFSTAEAQALFAGAAAHAFLPLRQPLTSSFGLMLLASAHVAGWPAAKGGSRPSPTRHGRAPRRARRDDRDRPSGSVPRRPPPVEGRALRRDATAAPRASRRCAPARYRRAARSLPLRARGLQGRLRAVRARSRGPTRPAVARAPSTSAARSRRWRRPRPRVAAGEHPERPFVLVAQQSLFDPTRAPAGRHTLWAYCHVPNGGGRRHDRAHRGAARALRAGLPRRRARPPQRRLVAASSPTTRTTSAATSPAVRTAGSSCSSGRDRDRVPYRTPNPTLFLCSASTPPGGGVHGMCGMHAAEAALAGVLR